jgi:tRNA modification GTPase
MIAAALVRAIIEAGAQSAGPGEFTARALLNGKLDLAQAEGVAAVVSAQNRRQLRAARQLAAGELSRRLAPMTETLARVVTLVEAGIDFADEGIDAISPNAAHNELTRLGEDIRKLLETSERFERAGHVPTIALVGRPNAGKSTLLNALCGRRRAVVSNIAGTTRDVLSADIMLASGQTTVIDMAGIEANEIAPTSMIEQVEAKMQNLAQRTAAAADVIVLLREVNDPRDPIELDRTPDVMVRTKADLAGDAAFSDDSTLAVSAVTGQAMTQLRRRLDQLAFGDSCSAAGDGTLTLSARHRIAIESAASAIDRALGRLGGNESEWVAAELRIALDELGSVTGVVSPDDILGRIFSTFCIGK